MILVACGLLREARVIRCPGLLPVAGGGDAAALEAGLEQRLAGSSAATALLSSGVAGGLGPALVAGDVVISGDPVLVGWLAKRLPAARIGGIIGQDSIAATAGEKQALAARHPAALAVDMESHVAECVARRHGLPFAAIRTISDPAGQSMPPAALVAMRADGSVNLGAVLGSLALKPGQLPALLRLTAGANRAFAALADVHDALCRAGIGRLDARNLGLDLG